MSPVGVLVPGTVPRFVPCIDIDHELVAVRPPVGDLLGEKLEHVSDVFLRVVRHFLRQEREKLFLLIQADEFVDDSGRCKQGLACLAFLRSYAVPHDGTLVPFVVDLGGKLEDDPFDQVPLHRIRT